MPRELARVTSAFADIQKRVGPMLENMDRLNNNFWNETSGNWGRYYAGLDMLADRLKQLAVPTASDPKAAADGEVKTLLQGIAKAKADCLGISKQYWGTAQRVDAISREVVALKTDVDKVIKEKSGLFKRSNSIPELKKLSQSLFAFKNDLNAATMVGPHKPNHAMLN